jgi:predicted component of type VI protein secretion system
MKLTLIVLTEGKQKGKAIPVRLPQFLVGRDPQCHLRPVSPLISKRHCAILQKEGKVFLRDFDSTNGTFVNGERVQGQQELKAGDRLKIGPIEVEVHLETAPPVNKPTPPPATKGAKPAAKPETEEAAKPAEKEEAREEKVSASAPRSGGTTDDDIAAMLLSGTDVDDDLGSSLSPGDIPEGSTVFDLPLPEGVAKQEGEQEPDKTMLDKVKGEQEGTSSAAKSLLEQYMKRPRT